MMSRLFCILVAWCCALAAPLCGQSNWTAVSSGTTRNLWGVCHGGGQFVAVGEGGTILTSPDGLVWTPRDSGTTRWLTAVAYGYRHYVAVGDAATLLTSPDGITWQEVEVRAPGSGIKPRLNTVRFSGDTFEIYGERDAKVQLNLPREVWSSIERGVGAWWRTSAFGLGRVFIGGESGLMTLDDLHFTPDRGLPIASADIRNVSGLAFQHGSFFAVGAGGVIVSSNNGNDWPRQSSGTTEDLHGLATFNNTLVAIGARGTILSQDAAERWQRRESPTTELLLGIAASEHDSAAIIVGGGGTILRAALVAQAPVIVVQPVSVSETNEGAASMTVRATGSQPLSYQWYREGRLLSGANQSTLRYAPLTSFDLGNYTVNVSNAAGSVSSEVARIQILPRPVSITDTSFNPTVEEAYTVTALLPLPDESLLVAIAPDAAKVDQPSYILKFQPDGRHDPTWRAGGFGGGRRYPDGRVRSVYVSALLRMNDGRIVVGGTFDSLDGQPYRNLIRLRADGTFDNTFLPPASATALPPLSLALQSRDRVIVANGSTTPLRLDVEGQLDPQFRPYTLPPEFPFPNSQRDWLARAVQVAPDDKILVGADVGLTRTLIAPTSNSTVIRLEPNGARDTSFTQLRWLGYGANLRALDDGGVLVAGRLQENAQGNYFQTASDGRIWRLRSDGTLHPGYPVLRIPNIRSTYFYADGRALYSTADPKNPVRLSAAGEVDDTFTGGIGNPSHMTVSPAGSIYVAGAFTLYNGRAAPGIARLVATPNPSPNAPRILEFRSSNPVVTHGQSIQFEIAAIGSADLTYEWQSDGGGVLAVTHRPTYTFTFDGRGLQPRAFRAVVRNSRGSATSDTIIATVLPTAPVIERQPTQVITQSDREALLEIITNATAGNVSLQWYRNGEPLPHPNGPWTGDRLYAFTPVRFSDAGTYTVAVRNIFGQTATSAPIMVRVDETSRFVNLSTRVKLDPREPRAIIGFTLAPGSNRMVLIRGAGPGLTRFGVTDPLARPSIELFSSDGVSRFDRQISGWSADLSQYFTRTGAFPFETGSTDAAAFSILEPGAYTVVLTAPPGEYGSALVEIYEADARSETMINLSTRAFIAPDAPATAGFAIRGQVAKPVLLRAAGPSLATFGVPNALANPRLVLRNERGDILGTNDDWDNTLRAAMNSVGAFPFDASSRDAALRLSLPPGNYTATIESADTGSGVALIEVYEFPP